MLSKCIALVLAAAYLASAASATTRINPWSHPHVFTISDAGFVSTLNPHLNQSAPVANMSELTMAWLVRWDEHNQPYPELATEVPSTANGDVSADGRTITYHLRKGVVWSDGTPFTADDVVFSTKVVNTKANNEQTRLDVISKVDEPDKYTVVYHLNKLYSPFVEAFFSSCCANPSILPKHLLARYPNINNIPYNDLPVGIGPFKFSRWDRGKQVVLVANPLYWRGRPKLDEIVYNIMPNRDALLAQVRAHKVDMWYQFGGAYLARIQAVNGYTVLKQPSYAYNHIDFNITHPVVADTIVRQALRLALDRPEILDKVAHGIGVVQDTATPINAPYYVDMGTTPYDPAKANALLDQAGWTRGPDGVRAKNGVKFALNFAVVSGAPDTDRLVAFVAKDWQRVGVQVHVHHYSPSLYFAMGPDGVINGNRWDAIVFAWAADAMGDYSGYYGCNVFPPVGWNNVRWCNKTAQAAMDALFGHFEQAQRTADVKAVMQQLIRDTPTIVTSMRVDMFACNQDLKNYHPNDLTIFDNMMNVDI